jgi:hypothetical protein
VVATVGDCRELGVSRFEWRFIGRDSEGEAGLPFHSFVDPFFENSHFIGGNAGIILGRHLVIRIRIENQFDKVGLVRLSGHGSIVIEEKLASIQGKSALCLFPSVAFRAVFFEQGHDIVGEIDLCLYRESGDRKNAEG